MLCATDERLEARLKKQNKTKLRPRRCSLVVCWRLSQRRPGGRVHTLLLIAGIANIPYRPTAGPGEVMCFKHYNAQEVGVGCISYPIVYFHAMPRLEANMSRAGADGEEDGGVAEVLGVLLALLLCNRYWGCIGEICLTSTMPTTKAPYLEPSYLSSHTGADPFGFPTLHRPWNEGTPMEAAKRRLQAAFEFFTKLGVRGNSFHSLGSAVDWECLSHCAFILFFFTSRWNITRFMTGNST